MSVLLLALAAVVSQSAPSEKLTLLRAERLFEPRSGTIVRPGRVLIRGSRIEAVGAKVELPAGAETIDLGDVTLLPGLIDAHVHIDFQRSDDFRRDELDSLRKPVAERALIAAQYARRTLEAGFTTVRNLGSADVIDIALKNAGNDGVAVLPRVLSSGASLGATGGHCDTHGYAEGSLAHDTKPGVADGPDAFRREVRKAIKYGADVVKLCATGGVLSEGDEVDVAQLTVEENQAAISEAHELRKKVAVHAHGDTGARRAVEAGADSIEHGTFVSDATFKLMRQKGAYLVPTPLNQKIYDEQIARGATIHPKVLKKIEQARKGRRDSFARALKAGVKIAFGTDAGVIPHGRNAEQFAVMVDYGMKPVDALRSGTIWSAELLGLAGELGTLEPGKQADVIAVRGDPLAEVKAIERVSFVMKGGAVVRRE